MTEDEIISMILAFHSDRSARGRRELPPPAPAEAVSELEEAVGYPMPPLLKRIYLEVADGRFTTPFRGAYSIKWKDDGPDETRPLLEQYLARARGFDPFYDLDDPYPGFLVPLEHRGCSVWAFVDWSTPEGRIWTSDHENGALFPERFTLAEDFVSSMAHAPDTRTTPAIRQGRPVRVEFHPGQGPPHTIHAVHDDKLWTVTTTRTHPTATSAWPTWSATILGPQPGNDQPGEHHVTLVPHRHSPLWWMDVSTAPIGRDVS